MRFEGKLVKWNDERGFGFIAPEPAGDEVFVHISAFARGGQRPQIGAHLSFEIALGKDGKKQATAVRSTAAAMAPVPGASDPYRRATQTKPGTSTGLPSRLMGFVLMCAVLAASYWHYGERVKKARATQATEATQEAPPRASFTVLQPAAQPSPGFRCDGRTSCSQMTSCAEATFFLRNCPGTKMDGNGDGVPCEQQWCTSPLAK